MNSPTCFWKPAALQQPQREEVHLEPEQLLALVRALNSREASVREATQQREQAERQGERARGPNPIPDRNPDRNRNLNANPNPKP